MYRERPFVAQLGWINWPPVNLQKAVVDYFRAYTQTARWVTEDLIGLDELQRFEDELVDEWQREFEFMQIELGAGASEEDKQRAGAGLLRELLDATEVRVRARYEDAFFARGNVTSLRIRAGSAGMPISRGVFKRFCCRTERSSSRTLIRGWHDVGHDGVVRSICGGSGIAEPGVARGSNRCGRSRLSARQAESDAVASLVRHRAARAASRYSGSAAILARDASWRLGVSQPGSARGYAPARPGADRARS